MALPVRSGRLLLRPFAQAGIDALHTIWTGVEALIAGESGLRFTPDGAVELMISLQPPHYVWEATALERLAARFDRRGR